MLGPRAIYLLLLSLILLFDSTYSYNRFKHINLSNLYASQNKKLILRATVAGNVFISNTAQSGIYDTINEKELIFPIPSLNPSIEGGGTVWPILAMLDDNTPNAIVYHLSNYVQSQPYEGTKQTLYIEKTEVFYYSIKYDENHALIAIRDRNRGNSDNSFYSCFVVLIQINPLGLLVKREYSKKICMANGVLNMENDTKKQIIVMCYDTSILKISYAYVYYPSLEDIVEGELIDYTESDDTVIQLTEINNEQFILCYPYSSSTKLTCASGTYTNMGMIVHHEKKEIMTNLSFVPDNTFTMCKYTSSRVMIGYGNKFGFKIALINYELDLEGTLDIFGAINYVFFDLVVLINSSLLIVGQSGQYSGKVYGYLYQPQECPDNHSYTIENLDCFSLQDTMPNPEEGIKIVFTEGASNFMLYDTEINKSTRYLLSELNCVKAKIASNLEFDIYNNKWFYDSEIAENSCLIVINKIDNCIASCRNCTNFGTDDNHLCLTCSDNYYKLENNDSNCYENLYGHYLENNVWKECYETCETCSKGLDTDQEPNIHNCIKCKTDYFYLYNTNCVEKWEENYFYDSTEDHYRPCAVQCATCEITEDNCKTCSEGYFWIEGTNQCVTKDSIIEGYYPDEDNAMFKKCYPTCLSCETTGTPELHQCKTCITEYDNSKEIESNCIKIIYESNDILRIISSKDILTLNLNDENQIIKPTESNIGSDFTVYTQAKPVHSVNGVLNFVDIDNSLTIPFEFEKETLYDIISYYSTPQTTSVFSYYKTNSIHEVISHQGTITIIVCPNFCQLCTSANDCTKCEDDKYTFITDPPESQRRCLEQCEGDAKYSTETPPKQCFIKCPNYSDGLICVDKCPPGKKENSENKCILDFLNEEKDSSYSSEKDSKDTIDSLDDYINDYVDIGPIITGEDFIWEIINPSDQEYQDNPSTSGIDFTECERILLKHYGISEIIIVKIDIFEEGSFMPIVEYRVYDKFGNKLDLIFCEDVTTTISKPITNPDAIDYEKALEYWENGINIYDRNNAIFINPCLHFHVNHKDWILSDRIKFIYKEVTFCEDWCENKSWDLINLRVECDCKVKEIETKIEPKATETHIYTIQNHNFRVWKCYKEVFELKMFTYNIGFYFISVLLWFELFIAFIYSSKTLKSVMSRIHERYKFYTESYKLGIRGNPPRKSENNFIVEQNCQVGCKEKKKEKDYNYDYFQRTIEDQEEEGELECEKDKNNTPNEVRECYEDELGKGMITPRWYHGNRENINIEHNNINRDFGKHNHNFFTDEDADAQQQSQGKTNNPCNKNKNTAAKSGNTNNKNEKINSKNSSTSNQSKAKTNFTSKNSKFEDHFKMKYNRNWVIYPKTSSMENLPYEKAITHDTRGYFSILCTLIREKFLILRICYPISEFEMRSFPFSILILKIGLSFTLTLIWYTERFISNKFWKYPITIIEHVYMAVISWSLSYVFCRVFSFSKQYYNAWEWICYEEKKTREFTLLLAMAFDKIKQRMKLLYISEIILLCCMWYYIICFCGVYQLTQWNWIISSLIAVAFDTIMTLLVIAFLSGLKFCALRCRSKKLFYFYGIGKMIL